MDVRTSLSRLPAGLPPPDPGLGIAGLDTGVAQLGVCETAPGTLFVNVRKPARRRRLVKSVTGYTNLIRLFFEGEAVLLTIQRKLMTC